MKTRTSTLAARFLSGLVGLAVVSGIGFLHPTVAAAGLDPADKCEMKKATAAGKYAKGIAVEFSKAIKKSQAADATKLAKWSDKFDTWFAKAEEKSDGSCPSNGDAAAVKAALDGGMDDVVTALGGVPGSGGDGAKCQSLKVKEAGKYSLCQFKALAKGIKKGLEPDFSKCDANLEKKWLKLETKTCDTSGDLGSVQSGIDAWYGSVADGLSGVVVEYQQDFESLDQASTSALADDGWLVYGNVFPGSPPSGYLYGYGPFVAPNGGPGFCGIDIGQGGPEQGSQQLVVYSNYDGAEQGNGNTVEANVFQERTIVAGDVGRTLTFQFDHKRGNINNPADPLCIPGPCVSTALAFIKTLDPSAGYALVDFITVDMTSIPDTWGTSSVTLGIDAPREGWVLQYGFSSQATLYQPSGIFYDNVVVSTAPTP